MDSIIELQRQTHEEIERFERALYTALSRPQTTHERKIQNEQKAAQMLDRICSKTTILNNLYLDEDARKVEINSLSPPSQQNDLSEFYSRLVKIQEHHNKYPDSVSGGIDLEIAALLEDTELDGEEEELEEEDSISLMFSGEEAYGKYVDLYANHVEYTNIKNIGKRPGYLQYLDLLIDAPFGVIHQDLPKDVRASKQYETYIKNLHQYLLGFAQRSQPLVDVEGGQVAAETEFNEAWEANGFPEWTDQKDASKPVNGEESGIWCAACQKHYSKQTVYDAHLTSKKHIKATAKQAAASDTALANPNGPTPPPTWNNTTKTKLREAARVSFLVTKLASFLLTTLNDTKSNVERRFSLTAREREQELLEQHKPPAAPTTAATEERIYNPLKLPLGWDGKPIPYWLYKLHGLGVEYRCEICSDHVYMGRKNFDRHFQESRHAFGMRALGLPNTKHFHEITKIEDALALAEKLKQEGRHEIFQQETMEELEDDEGNVYNRKTYEDLKKQGII
ncbi:hypothetical protein BDN72DRAFT_408415 [Pluteus cervinus]|uniref:Uncharacterized protein n=1 Tax=Pluteus cervinus TaxID=181527 RepID=A0ACD3B2D2_9AGAR|nr:hypothetical protein BDN72DRAFT_408415 [Pluteus cervinus]